MGEGRVLLIQKYSIMEQYVEEGLVALVPVYDQDCRSKVITLKGHHREPRSVRWLIEKLAACYSLNLSGLRQRYGAILNVKHHVAVPIKSDLIMLPFKLRQVRVPGDITMGYISLLQIAEVMPLPEGEPGPWLSVISFKNGESIKTLNHPETIRERLRQGEIVRSDFLKLRNQGPGFSGLSKRSLVEQLPNCECLLKDLFVDLISIDGGRRLKTIKVIKLLRSLKPKV